ncbi:hypothetical protein MHBO_004587 [Bonamia ostreae]|uniref:Uncharacterized protein n=1 Tax=Bonamia ostreae TaxID=126728 RepID=A0ABV2AUB9_9EUKA
MLEDHSAVLVWENMEAHLRLQPLTQSPQAKYLTNLLVKVLVDLRKNVTLTVLRMYRVVSDLRMEVVKSYVVKRMKSERMSFLGWRLLGLKG